jgi:hypothetical protein
LYSFQRYKKILKRAITKDAEYVNLDTSHIFSPLRLWNIEYDSKEEQYQFTALNNEKIIIKEEKAILWEKATGKKNIYETSMT